MTCNLTKVQCMSMYPHTITCVIDIACARSHQYCFESRWLHAQKVKPIQPHDGISQSHRPYLLTMHQMNPPWSFKGSAELAWRHQAPRLSVTTIQLSWSTHLLYSASGLTGVRIFTNKTWSLQTCLLKFCFMRIFPKNLKATMFHEKVIS